MTTKIACTSDDDGYVTQEIRIISIPIRMIIDMMAFTGAYGHRTTLETKRTNPAFREAFRVYSTEMATNREDEFWNSWKDFRARYPAEERPSSAAGPEHQRLRTLHAESEDELVEQGNAAGGVAGTSNKPLNGPPYFAKTQRFPPAAPAASTACSWHVGSFSLKQILVCKFAHNDAQTPREQYLAGLGCTPLKTNSFPIHAEPSCGHAETWREK